MKAEDKLITKIKHRKPNEWIPRDYEEWYGKEHECPFCGYVTIDANNYCPCCGEKMIGGDSSEEIL